MGCGGSSSPTGWARGASPIYVPMSPPLIPAVFPAGTAPTAGPPGRLSPSCDVQMSPVTLQHLPGASPRGSLANTFIVLIPSCGTRPPRLATPGTGDGQGRGLAARRRGSCSFSPPRALWHQLRALGATQCPGWHLRPSPPSSGGTKPQKEGTRGTGDPGIPPGILVTCRVCSSTRRGL